MTTIEQVTKAIPTIRPFINPAQLEVLGDACRGEEAEYFKTMIVELADRIENMPKTYDTDGAGDEAIVYLHYFIGGNDWYIVEKDKGDGSDDTRQIQAFGFVSLMGGYPELGYISIEELIGSAVELDLHWTPITLAKVKAA